MKDREADKIPQSCREKGGKVPGILGDWPSRTTTVYPATGKRSAPETLRAAQVLIHQHGEAIRKPEV